MSRRKAKKESPWRQHMRRAAVYAGGGLLVLVLAHTLFGPYGYLSMRRSQAEVRKVQQELDHLDRENQQLSGEVRALQTDPSAIEKVAREDMGLARPNEMIFPIPDDPSQSTGQPQAVLPQAVLPQAAKPQAVLPQGQPPK
jgi:cell division protein FtsB